MVIFDFSFVSTNRRFFENTSFGGRMFGQDSLQEGLHVKEYHSDNGTFSSQGFQADCNAQEQKYSYSGGGAKHQNGVAERNIQTVANWARASLLHAAYRCPAKASVRHWPMTIDYATWVFNRLPQIDTGLSPDEIWSSTRHAHEDFRRAHVFGCPVYVLEPKLQDGKKIPKWNPRSCLGMFMGFSALHSSLVQLVLNVRTGKISPQYHVIFDDKFETVASLPSNESLSKQWNKLFKLDCEVYLDVEYDQDGTLKTSHLPDLSPEWLPTDYPVADPTVPTSTTPSTNPSPTPIDLTDDDSITPLPSSIIIPVTIPLDDDSVPPAPVPATTPNTVHETNHEPDGLDNEPEGVHDASGGVNDVSGGG